MEDFNLTKNKTYVIAEAGVNHNGSIDLAIELISEAKKTGADCVKFQTFQAKNIVSQNSPKANYQLKSTNPLESQFHMLKKLELDKESFSILKDKCDEIGIDFMSTPYNIEDIHLLDSLDVKIFKVASGQLTEHYFLKEIAKTGKQIILSTGMATLGEVFESVEIIKEFGINPYVLQCTTNYPSRITDSNINAMLSIKQSCQVEVGYSDHVSNNFACYAAVANGAKIIEKHFTLDKNMEGPDHKASLNPKEFKELVYGIRQTEEAMGSFLKKPTEEEKKNIFAMKRSIILKNDVTKGNKIKMTDFGFKRPLNGIEPKYVENFIGKTVKQNLSKDDVLKWSDIE